MPHHHVQHAQNVGPNLFMRNENHDYIMPHVTACAVTAMCVSHSTCMQASWLPLCKCGVPEITYEHAIRASQTISKKINHLTF